MALEASTNKSGREALRPKTCRAWPLTSLTLRQAAGTQLASPAGPSQHLTSEALRRRARQTQRAAFRHWRQQHAAACHAGQGAAPGPLPDSDGTKGADGGGPERGSLRRHRGRKHGRCTRRQGWLSKIQAHGGGRSSISLDLRNSCPSRFSPVTPERNGRRAHRQRRRADQQRGWGGPSGACRRASDASPGARAGPSLVTQSS